MLQRDPPSTAAVLGVAGCVRPASASSRLPAPQSVPLSLSAEPARALAARCFRRVGLWRTRLTDDHVLRAVRKTMLRKSYCVMVTDGPDGATARVVQPHAPDADLTVHLGTASGSRKARHVARTGSAVLVYQDDGRAACVVLHCDAEVVDLDADGRARWFMTAWLAFWPLGPTDEDFVVIRAGRTPSRSGTPSAGSRRRPSASRAPAWSAPRTVGPPSRSRSQSSSRTPSNTHRSPDEADRRRHQAR
jgi:general stress protein 26